MPQLTKQSNKKTTPLREQMIMEMQLRNFSERTIETYTDHVLQFAKYFMRSPEVLGDEHIRKYLHYSLVIKQHNASYVNVTRSALKFLYKQVMNRPWDIEKIPAPKGERKLPEILSLEEVDCVLHTPRNLKHQMILMVTYSGGLRVSETTKLKLTDIDSKRMLIRVEQGKGKKDRYTLLSEPLLPDLRRYYKQFKPKHYLFEGRVPGKPLSEATLQTVFNKAKEAAGIQKQVTFHTLRHCFATHMLESGYGLEIIQKCMGHKNVQTTMRYLHIRHDHLQKVVSPLDQLLGD